MQMLVEAQLRPKEKKKKNITYTEGQMLHDPSYMLHLK